MATNDEKVNFEISEIDEIGGEGYALAKRMLKQENIDNKTNKTKSTYWATIVQAIERNMRNNKAGVKVV